MAIPDANAAMVLAMSARHCCICRRFKPLHLHVHHILEKSDGGTDEVENLIPTCMTCHSDVHTQTKLTRRFTRQELILHRDAVYALVREGKLPHPESSSGSQQAYEHAMNAQKTLADETALLPESIELLLTAVKSPYGEYGEDSPIIALHDSEPFFIRIGTANFGHRDARSAARYRRAFMMLVDRGFLEPGGGALFRLTDTGWILGDELIASGTSAL